MTATDAEIALVDELLDKGQYDKALQCIYQSELPPGSKERLLRDWERRTGREAVPPTSPVAGLIRMDRAPARPYA